MAVSDFVDRMNHRMKIPHAEIKVQCQSKRNGTPIRRATPVTPIVGRMATTTAPNSSAATVTTARNFMGSSDDNVGEPPSSLLRHVRWDPCTHEARRQSCFGPSIRIVEGLEDLVGVWPDGLGDCSATIPQGGLGCLLDGGGDEVWRDGGFGPSRSLGCSICRFLVARVQCGLLDLSPFLGSQWSKCRLLILAALRPSGRREGCGPRCRRKYRGGSEEPSPVHGSPSVLWAGGYISHHDPITRQ